MKGLFEETSSGVHEWLSPDNLVGKLFKVEVVTVTHDQERASLGRNQYSKIKPIFKLLHT